MLWQEKVFQSVMAQVVGFVQTVEGADAPEPVSLVGEGVGEYAKEVKVVTV